MKLDIYVQDRHVGVLEQTDITSFVFTYLPDVPPELAVSVLMPPRTESWTSSFLFPVFQVSLPEGAVRQRLERAFAKNFDRFDDMTLLAIVGESLIGQIKAVPHGEPLTQRSIHESLGNLLGADLSLLVEHYLGADDGGPGVSGGFLKFLASSPIEGEGTTRTLALDNWIIKLSDPDRDNIVLLEHFGMLAAQRMGLPTANTHLAPSLDRLLVQRFDRNKLGMPLGFEDMCALTGMPAKDKFTGSVERVIKTIKAFCPGRSGLVQLEQFYSQYLLANTIRNGDAHLKNFAMLYEPGGQPYLAPVYDMLSMSVYAPRHDHGDALDGMAITFGGTKRWLDQKAITRLGALCQVSPARQEAIKRDMAKALIDTANEVRQFVKDQPEVAFDKTARRMIELWSHGMKAVDEKASQALAQVAQDMLDEPSTPSDAPTQPAQLERQRP